jgi:hypothetical protein
MHLNKLGSSRRNESSKTGLNPGSVALEFSVMRRSNWTPSIVPRGDEQDVYLVVDDLGRFGRVWREAEFETTNYETVILDLLEGQYKNPIGIFCFNPFKGWSKDVSETSPANCAGTAICSCGMCRPAFRVLSSGVRARIATSSFPCRCVRSERGQPPRQAARDRRQGPLPRVCRTGSRLLHP